MTKTKLVLASFLLAGVLGGAQAANAAEPATPITSVQKAELDSLSPTLRKRVEARLGNGETVRGVLDTMLLNQVSKDFADGTIVATDFDRGTFVVQGKNGQMRSIPFKVETLEIR